MNGSISFLEVFHVLLPTFFPGSNRLQRVSQQRLASNPAQFSSSVHQPFQCRFDLVKTELSKIISCKRSSLSCSFVLSHLICYRVNYYGRFHDYDALESDCSVEPAGYALHGSGHLWGSRKIGKCKEFKTVSILLAVATYDENIFATFTL